MARARYSILAFAAIVVLAALGGCGAGHEKVRPTVGIPVQEFRDGGLAVAGVTVIEEVEQVRPPLIAGLEQVLRTDRPDLPFREAASVRGALGLPAYRRLLMAYQTTATLKPEELAEFKTALGPGTRYVLLARVDKISVSESGRPGQFAPAMANDFYAIRRDAKIRFTLFDLTTARAAFEGTYASSSQNTVPDSSRVRNAPLRPGEGTVLTTPRVNPEVRTPDLAYALEEAYRDFASDLPR